MKPSIPFIFMYYSTNYLSQNVLFISLIYLLDIFPIIMTSIKCSIHLNHFFNKKFITSYQLNQDIQKYYSYLSILPLFKNLMSCETESSSDQSAEYCIISSVSLIIIVLFILLLIILLFFLSKLFIFNYISTDKEIPNSIKVLKEFQYKLFVNFYDLIFYRLGSFYIIFFISNFFVNTTLQEIQSVYVLIALLLLCCYLILLYYHFSGCFIFVKIGIKYPFDVFTKLYDIFLLFIKVIYSFEINLSMQSENKYSSLSIFLGFIGVFSNLLFVIIVWLKLVLRKRDMIYYLNSKSNLFRLFLLIYQSLCIIGFCLFRTEYSIMLHVSTHIAFLIFSVTLIIKFQAKYNEKLFHNNELNQLLYIIENYNLLEPNLEAKNSQTQFIASFCMKIILTHWHKCELSKFDCPLCSIYDSDSIEKIRNAQNTYDTLISNVFKGLFLYINKLKLNKRKDWKYRCIKFIYSLLQTKNNYFRLSLVINKTYKKLKNTNRALAINVLLYYKVSMGKMNQISIKLNSLNLLNEQSQQINQMLSEIESALFIKVFNPNNIISSAIKVYSLNKKLLQSILKQESKDQYQTIITKFILEKLLMKKLPGSDEFALSQFEEIIQDHYDNDCHLIMNFDLSNTIIKIISSGKELNKFNSNQFEDMFYADTKTSVKSKFIESMNKQCCSEDNHFFQFPIQDKDHSNYLNSFKIRYLVLPTFNLKDCLLFGIYQIQGESSIMTIFNNKTKHEYLLRYSFDLKKDIMIPYEFIEELSMNQIFVDIQNLFDMNKIEENIMQINYQTYCPYVKNILLKMLSFQKKSNSTEADSYQVITEIIAQCSNNSLSLKELRFKSKIESIIQDKDLIIKVYLFDKERERKNIYNEDIWKFEKDNDIDVTNILQFNVNSIHNNNSSMGGTYLSMDTSTGTVNCSSVSSMRSAKSSLFLSSVRFQDDAKEKKNQTHKFRVFTHVIFVFNIFLVFLTIVFLVIQFNKTTSLNNMFQFYIIWIKIFREFFHSVLNVFFSICTSLPHQTTCENSFLKYEKDLGKQLGFPDQFSIQKYVFEELFIKTNGLKDTLLSFSVNCYTLNEKLILDVIEQPYYFRYLSIVGEEASVKEEEYTFINSLNVFVGILTHLVSNRDYASKPIYIIEIHGSEIEDIDLKYIRLDILVTESQINGYNIILNFPIYINFFYTLNEIIYKLLNYNIKECNIVVIAFSTLLISFHLVLFTICCWFLSFFRFGLDKNMKTIKKIIDQGPLKKDIIYKLIELKKLSLFYQHNPIKIINTFLIQEGELKRKSKNNNTNSLTYSQQQQQQKEFINANLILYLRNETLFKPDKYVQIFKLSKLVLLCLVSIYLIYSILFLFLLLTSFADYLLIIQALHYNSMLETNLSSLTALLQVILMTNQTEIELHQYLTFTNSSTNETNNVIDILFLSTYDNLFKVEQLETDEIIPIKYDFNCNTIYDEINDTIIYLTNQSFDEYNYLALIPDICNSYKFTQLNNTNTIIYETISRVKSMIKTIQHNYKDLFETNDSRELFDFYLIMLFIFRPLRNYQTSSLYNNVIADITRGNNWITYVYLFLNIILELFLFLMIRAFIIKRFNLINKSMNTFIRSIKLS